MENEEWFNVRLVVDDVEEVITCTPENTVLNLHGKDNSQYDNFFYQMETKQVGDVSIPVGAFITRLAMGDQIFYQYASLCVNSGNWDISYRVKPHLAYKKSIDELMAELLVDELEDITVEDFLDGTDD